MSLYLDQISPDKWTRALQDWYEMDDRQETDHSLYHEDPKIIAIFVLRDSESRIKLVAAQEDQLFATTPEKLSIEKCIKITELLMPNYNNQQDYDYTCNALSRMKNRCTSIQENRIDLLVNEAMEMSNALCQSIQTAQEDWQRDFITTYFMYLIQIFKSLSTISIQPNATRQNENLNRESPKNQEKTEQINSSNTNNIDDDDDIDDLYH